MKWLLCVGIGGLGALLGVATSPCRAQLLLGVPPATPVFFPQTGPFFSPLGQTPFFGPIGQTPFFGLPGQAPFLSPLGQNGSSQQTFSGQSNTSQPTSLRTFRQFGRGQQNALIVRPLPNLAANNSNLVGNALASSLFASALANPWLNTPLTLGNPWLGNGLLPGNPWLGNPLFLGNPWLGNSLFVGNPWLGNSLFLGNPWSGPVGAPWGLAAPGLGAWGLTPLWGTPASLWGNPFLTTPGLGLWGNGLSGGSWGTPLTPGGLSPWGTPWGGWGLPGINPFANPFLTSPLGTRLFGGVQVSS
jgi:hypothetical protein